MHRVLSRARPASVSLARPHSARLLSGAAARAARPTPGSAWGKLAAAGVVVASGVLASETLSASEAKVDYVAVSQAIEELLDDDKHDDGSLGPIFVRLAWHASGTYSKSDGSGGSSTGASMRFSPESDWGANAGLGLARARLEAIKKKFPEISYADLWTLAGKVAIEAMGGPTIPWSPGRSDCTEETAPKLPDGLLPDADQGAQHLRNIFYRMGFNDKEIVALSGAHTLGRCHETSSGYVDPWTTAPTTFSNLYFQFLVDKRWERKTVHKGKKWNGPEQYTDSTGELMMLKTDLALMEDSEFRKYVEIYAKDEQAFFADFAAAFSKLLSNGVGSPKPWYQFW